VKRDRYAHVVGETTGDGLGVVESKECLVRTSMRDRGRVCSTLQMAEDLADDLTLRDGGTDPQRPALTTWAARHGTCPYPLQQPRRVEENQTAFSTDYRVTPC
jgi:hypothetical protein